MFVEYVFIFLCFFGPLKSYCLILAMFFLLVPSTAVSGRQGRHSPAFFWQVTILRFFPGASKVSQILRLSTSIGSLIFFNHISKGGEYTPHAACRMPVELQCSASTAWLLLVWVISSLYAREMEQVPCRAALFNLMHSAAGSSPCQRNPASASIRLN